MPSNLIEAYNALPSGIQTTIRQKFAELDSDVETRVDGFLKTAVDRAEGWHRKQALVGLYQRKDAAAEVFGLAASVSAGALLYGLAQGAIVAAGVSASAASFGVVPAVGLAAGVIILYTKAEIHHKRVTLNFKSGLKKLKAARAATAARNANATTDAREEFVTQFASVMHEAGEKLNRKYLRVTRVSKKSLSRFILKSGSFHTPFFGAANQEDITKAQQLVTSGWDDSSKNKSLMLAVLELHFYGTTIYQALEEYLEVLSIERTRHLNNMTALRAHIVRQMHLGNNHARCGAACGKQDPATLNVKCAEISQMIIDGYDQLIQVEIDRRLALKQSEAMRRQEKFQRIKLHVQSIGSDGSRDLRIIGKKMEDNKAGYSAALAEFNQAGDLIQTYQTAKGNVSGSTKEVTSASFMDGDLISAGWHRTRINATELNQRVAQIKAEEAPYTAEKLLQAATGEISGASVLAYGADQAGNAAGNAVSESVTVAAGAASVPVGPVVGLTIDTLRDLYEARQLVRRLDVGGKASREVWTTLKTSGLDAALDDLRQLGLTREKLPALGMRIQHYVGKMKEIDEQIDKVQRQAPYMSMFEKTFFDNSIFASCQDAIDAWHACCYKDKQYAKLETSALAFLGIMKKMQQNLEGATHGTVVKPGLLFTKADPPSQPSYYDQL